jgi:hypothetical protein
LQKIQAGVDRILKDCNNTLLERRIMRKARGPNFISAIEHTIAKDKNQGKKQNGKVFSGRGNLSPIGQPPPVVAGGNAAPGISKSTKQRHPGKATLEKSKMTFCEWCGTYITRKCTLCNIFCTHTLLAINWSQHLTKTKKHADNVKRNVRCVDCVDCGQIHQIGSCAGK